MKKYFTGYHETSPQYGVDTNYWCPILFWKLILIVFAGVESDTSVSYPLTNASVFAIFS
jgi:hypothetical protein